ncbi:hypothetical protein PVAND_014695 [Polypedilum vanderplanki]|uniref:Hemolymph juvenile hormone binding protein n=1 Tax=Polypedilum vanderplanki TaxID=319348 RepID=A0A9J6BAR9_POLVA|nr:hypothetical protein PVAND_014695 [Polypedilum vanderplanki]
MMKTKIIFAIFLIISSSFIETFGKLPSTIPICSRNHPKLSECIINAIEILRPSLRTGDFGQGFRVPPLEPFTVPQINFGEEQGLQVFLSNVQVRGASKFVIDKLRVNFNELKMDLLLTTPKLDISGKYKLKFNFLSSLVNSEGEYFTTFENGKIRASLKGYKFMKNGKEYAKIDPVGIQFQRGQVTNLKMTNLFNGNVVLSEIVHGLLTSNPDYVLNNIYPQVNKYLSNLATEVASRIIVGHSLEELFPY